MPKGTEDNLKRIVNFLSRNVGSRAYHQIAELAMAAEFIEIEFKQYGYEVFEQRFTVHGNSYRNLFIEIRGRKYPERVIIVGAHYDTVTGTPGADDNASGIAGILELAKQLRNSDFDRTVRFVAFTLEEPPFFRTDDMGSYRYAQHLSQRGEQVESMISLEMIGYFLDRPKSQYFPSSIFKLYYPDRANFIMLVSNRGSKDLLGKIRVSFQKGTDLPVESISIYSIVPGVDFSDHWSFYQFDYKAVMVTDTAFYRNPNYHRIGDLPETLDYVRMAKVVIGLKLAIEDLANIS